MADAFNKLMGNTKLEARKKVIYIKTESVSLDKLGRNVQREFCRDSIH